MRAIRMPWHPRPVLLPLFSLGQAVQSARIKETVWRLSVAPPVFTAYLNKTKGVRKGEVDGVRGSFHGCGIDF